MRSSTRKAPLPSVENLDKLGPFAFDRKPEPETRNTKATPSVGTGAIGECARRAVSQQLRGISTIRGISTVSRYFNTLPYVNTLCYVNISRYANTLPYVNTLRYLGTLRHVHTLLHASTLRDVNTSRDVSTLRVISTHCVRLTHCLMSKKLALCQRVMSIVDITRNVNTGSRPRAS